MKKSKNKEIKVDHYSIFSFRELPIYKDVLKFQSIKKDIRRNIFLLRKNVV